MGMVVVVPSACCLGEMDPLLPVLLARVLRSPLHRIPPWVFAQLRGLGFRHALQSIRWANLASMSPVFGGIALDPDALVRSSPGGGGSRRRRPAEPGGRRGIPRAPPSPHICASFLWRQGSADRAMGQPMRSQRQEPHAIGQCRRGEARMTAAVSGIGGRNTPGLLAPVLGNAPPQTYRTAVAARRIEMASQS